MMIVPIVIITIIADLNGSTQSNGNKYRKKGFPHINFLLRFTHGDDMCAAKISRNCGPQH